MAKRDAGAGRAAQPRRHPAGLPHHPTRSPRPQHPAGRLLCTQAAASRATSADYHAYVAEAGGYSVAEVDTATDTVLSDSISADSPEGVAVRPDGSQVFVAEAGQYDVIAVNTATGTETPIEVGPYPQDVAVSPDGSQVYATVTGGDTGPGGSDTVAVINPAADAVVRDITVGTGPRQVVFSPDGSRAHVTTETGISVIDAATGPVTGTIPDSAGTGPQGIAVSPDGRTLYVTNPGTGTVRVISAATGRVTARIAAGAEPFAVAVPRAGPSRTSRT
jgi:YVTN family beta-propeller protein